MALRILSGMLFINGGPKNGAAVITFSPFTLATAPGTVSLNKARVIGANGTFRHPPASIVAPPRRSPSPGPARVRSSTRRYRS